MCPCLCLWNSNRFKRTSSAYFQPHSAQTDYCMDHRSHQNDLDAAHDSHCNHDRQNHLEVLVDLLAQCHCESDITSASFCHWWLFNLNVSPALSDWEGLLYWALLNKSHVLRHHRKLNALSTSLTVWEEGVSLNSKATEEEVEVLLKPLEAGIS